MARSMWMARRPNAVAVAANSTAVAGMKPPPRPMMAISAARPPRMRTIAFGSKLSRAGKSPRHASQKLPAASSGHAGGDDVGHRLRAHAVGRGELHRAGVPEDHQRRSAAARRRSPCRRYRAAAALRPCTPPQALRHRRACPGDPLCGTAPGHGASRRPGHDAVICSVLLHQPNRLHHGGRRGSARPPGTWRTASPGM